MGTCRMLLFEQAVPMDAFDGSQPASPGSYGGGSPPPDTDAWPLAMPEEDASADELAALEGLEPSPPAAVVPADAPPTEPTSSAEAGSPAASDAAAPADVPSATAVPVQVEGTTLLSHESSRQDLSAGAADSAGSRDAAMRLASASAGPAQWSGGQVAGIVLGMAAVGGVAAAAVVGYRRRARAAASRYAFARGHEVEMRGLI